MAYMCTHISSKYDDRWKIRSEVKEINIPQWKGSQQWLAE